MTITGQAGNLFTFYIFKETPHDQMSHNEITKMISEAEKNTGKKVNLKFQNNHLRKNFHTYSASQQTLPGL